MDHWQAEAARLFGYAIASRGNQEEIGRALAEMHRILSEGGDLMVTVIPVDPVENHANAPSNAIITPAPAEPDVPDETRPLPLLGQSVCMEGGDLRGHIMSIHKVEEDYQLYIKWNGDSNVKNIFWWTQARPGRTIDWTLNF